MSAERDRRRFVVPSIVVAVLSLYAVVRTIGPIRPESADSGTLKLPSSATSEALHGAATAAAGEDDTAANVIELPAPALSQENQSSSDDESRALSSGIAPALPAMPGPAIAAPRTMTAFGGAALMTGSGGAGAAGSAPALESGMSLGFANAGSDSSGSTPQVNGPAGNHSGWALVAGGEGNNKLAVRAAELFVPTQMKFVTTGAMITARSSHTATMLPNGTALIAGGDDTNGQSLSSAELYDPNTGNFTATGAMVSARASHTATLITGCKCSADGKVLIVGGIPVGGGQPTGTAELYDPQSGTFAATGTLHLARYAQTATAFPNGPLAGDILIAGGIGGGGVSTMSAEIYDPRTGEFTPTGAMTTPRAHHTATWLVNSLVSGPLSGQVLLVGGDAVSDNATATAETYDPASGTFSEAGTMLVPRTDHVAAVMMNGDVLIAGGENPVDGPLLSAEVFDPTKNNFAPTASMSNVHVDAVATILDDGRVLIAAGHSAAAEVYSPSAGTFATAAAMQVDASEAAAALLGR